MYDHMDGLGKPAQYRESAAPDHIMCVSICMSHFGLANLQRKKTVSLLPRTGTNMEREVVEQWREEGFFLGLLRCFKTDYNAGCPFYECSLRPLKWNGTKFYFFLSLTKSLYVFHAVYKLLGSHDPLALALWVAGTTCMYQGNTFEIHAFSVVSELKLHIDPPNLEIQLHGRELACGTQFEI